VEKQEGEGRKYGGRAEEPGFIPRKSSITLSVRLLADIEALMAREGVSNLSWTIRRLLRLGLQVYNSGKKGETRPGEPLSVSFPPTSRQVLEELASRYQMTADQLVAAIVTEGLQSWVDRALEKERHMKEVLARLKSPQEEAKGGEEKEGEK
jgi:metal-responsive CopG/Arc/MetJ family transcriptional regulator